MGFSSMIVDMVVVVINELKKKYNEMLSNDKTVADTFFVPLFDERWLMEKHNTKCVPIK